MGKTLKSNKDLGRQELETSGTGEGAGGKEAKFGIKPEGIYTWA